MMYRIAVILLLAALSAACSGTAPPVTVAPAVDRSEAPDTTETEQFDISPFRDEPATISVEVVHDVPPELMANQADAGIERTVDGFRVQLFSSLDQAEAATAEETARTFWSDFMARVDSTGYFPADLRVYRFFRQPYYRVRAGDFTNRMKADSVASVFSFRFRDAFVVPDQVTIRKD